MSRGGCDLCGARGVAVHGFDSSGGEGYGCSPCLGLEDEDGDEDARAGLLALGQLGNAIRWALEIHGPGPRPIGAPAPAYVPGEGEDELAAPEWREAEDPRL